MVSLAGFYAADDRPDKPSPAFALGYGQFGFGARIGLDSHIICPNVAEEWTHVAITWNQDSGVGIGYCNGAAAMSFGGFDSIADATFRLGSDLPGGAFIDEVLMLERAAAPVEIASLVLSGKPYGESLVPMAQPDLEDLRVVRITGSAQNEVEQPVDFELIGRRPISDHTLSEGILLGLWNFDGSIEASAGGGASEGPIGLSNPLPDPFGVPGRSMLFDSGGPSLWLDRDLRFDQEFGLQVWLAPASPGSSECSKAGCDVSYHQYEGGHDMASWRRELPADLRALFSPSK